MPTTVEPAALHCAAELIDRSRRILVLTGAGISTSCGIPDFRSTDGLYALLQAEDAERKADASAEGTAATPDDVVSETTRDNSRTLRRSSRSKNNAAVGSLAAEIEYHIDDPQDIMNINVFRTHPQVFYNHVHRLFPSSEVKPSKTHRWIKRLEENGKLIRQYTQNIDGLESKADIKAVFYCHGLSHIPLLPYTHSHLVQPGFITTSTCISCKHRVETATLRETIMKKQVPRCARCCARDSARSGKKRKGGKVGGVYKPDITFFHEPVPLTFHTQSAKDIPQVDLLIVIGTSLLIPPVKDIPGQMPGVPKILINRDRVKGMDDAGDCDDIVMELESRCAVIGGT
ncbi:hypothetical protein QFC20_006615 [Naganishia adeliensis]|uniref:Uncharacterized protein n=1 Tax=Naganishia adeliensis TaxID=92952 RepID=A0ACC2V938_9TREE|nr:hypothetical protein QFC20_006615 [Naganishia adeliensis]